MRSSTSPTGWRSSTSAASTATHPEPDLDSAAAASSPTREALERKLQEQERWIRTLDAQIRLLELERQKLSAVVHHADAGFFLLDETGRIIWASDFLAKRLSGRSHAAELLGSSCREVLCREGATCEGCPAAAAFRSRGVAHHELALTISGRPRHLYATAMPLRSPRGDVDQTMVMVQDVSDLEVLRRSDDRTRLLLGQMPAILWTTDTDLRVTSSVGAGLSGLGHEPDEVVGKTLFEYFGTGDREHAAIAAHGKAMAGEPQPFELEWQGRAFHVHVEALLDAGGHVIGTVGAALDVTERKKAEESLRQSEARKDAVTRMALDAVITIDDKGEITEWNPAAEGMFGYARGEALGRSLATLLVPERLREGHRLGLARAVATGESTVLGRRIELQAKRRDGSEFPVEIAIARIPLQGPPAFTGYVRDLTERKEAEATLRERAEQLRQSQKMEAIGTLAGGVAHDFNNILTGILGYAALLKRGAQAGDRVHKGAEVIEKAAERGAALTRQLLGFARRGKNQTIPVDLQDSLREVVALLGRTVDKNIHLVQRTSPLPLFVCGDPAQIQQVVLNLAVNARDAMPEGGELEVGVDAVVLGERDEGAGALPAGEYVRLSVRDTGCGIAEEHLPRIFEPFFTTKERGKGTGMGLAMVYGIVKNHGGSVRVESRHGQGTTVQTYLPRAAAPEVATGGPEAPAAPDAVRGSGRILVVDDEELVREATAAFLEDLGYQVATAGDGESAVLHYRRHSGEIDLVLLDLVMPRMGGRECFRALKAIDGGVRAVLCSGYGFNIAAQELLDEGVLEFLPKPYALGDLSEAVARVLAARR